MGMLMREGGLMRFKRLYESSIFTAEQKERIDTPDYEKQRVKDTAIEKNFTIEQKNEYKRELKHGSRTLLQKMSDILERGEVKGLEHYPDWREAFRSVFDQSLKEYGDDENKNKFLKFAKEADAADPQKREVTSQYPSRRGAIEYLMKALNEGDVYCLPSENKLYSWMLDIHSYMSNDPKYKISALVYLSGWKSRDVIREHNYTDKDVEAAIRLVVKREDKRNIADVIKKFKAGDISKYGWPGEEEKESESSKATESDRDITSTEASTGNAEVTSGTESGTGEEKVTGTNTEETNSDEKVTAEKKAPKKIASREELITRYIQSLYNASTKATTTEVRRWRGGSTHVKDANKMAEICAKLLGIDIRK